MQRRIAQRPAESDKGVRRRKENGSARRQFLRPEALAAFDDFVEVKVVLDGDELMGKGNGMHGKLLFGKIVAMPDSRWKLISIRTLCGEGNLDAEKTGVGVTISIYALGEEDDLVTPLRTAI